jgi:RNase P subunit RPR2
MRKKIKRRRKGLPIGDPFDRDMRIEDARNLCNRWAIREIVYSELPQLKRCCDFCHNILTNDDKIRGKDKNGQDCVVYLCGECGVMNRL